MSEREKRGHERELFVGHGTFSLLIIKRGPLFKDIHFLYFEANQCANSSYQTRVMVVASTEDKNKIY